MTRDEQDRIDKLINDIAEWKIERHEDLIAAISTHQQMCFAEHLIPIQERLDQLLECEKSRQIEAKQRRRWIKILVGVVAFLATVVALFGGIVEHFFLLKP